MRIAACVCCAIAFGICLLAQEASPGPKLNIGTPKALVGATYGKRFGLFKVEADDGNATIGVPIGTWEVYHLTAPPDRMYVTIVHFGTRPTPNSASSELIDSLMLMPAASTTVAQLLADQPAFASACMANCDIVLVTNHAGNRSLLLRPKDSRANTVLYFDGDSAGRWKSVTSLESVVSWAYVLSRSAFETHHQATDDRVIGSWSQGALGEKQHRVP